MILTKEERLNEMLKEVQDEVRYDNELIEIYEDCVKSIKDELNKLNDKLDKM